MSDGLTVRTGAFPAHAGVGMLEYLVALLIFSLGMMGLLSAQLVGKKTSFEASQRSFATALIRDMLERMYANPGETDAYQVVVGEESGGLEAPETLCDSAQCSPGQLAIFDVWQWESLVLGESEQDAAGHLVGLLAPHGCIASAQGAVDVTISWRGVLRTAMTAGPDGQRQCDGADEEPVEEDRPQRHQLTVSTFVARR